MTTRTTDLAGRKARNPVLRWTLALLAAGVVWLAFQLPATGPAAGAGTRIGSVRHERLAEVSGIAVSRQNPGVIWAHNDSGDSARLFAMRADGTHLGVFTLPGARAIDYEDMAIGPGPVDGIDYLYVADTGNNRLERTIVTVYRSPEPALASDGLPVNRPLDKVEALPMSFPDRPHECETLLVDPLNGDIYLISRDRYANRKDASLVFRNPAPQKAGVKTTLELIAELSTTFDIKGGDLSPDGSTILLRPHAAKRRTNALLWTWDRTRTLAQVFAEPGLQVPAAFERQGEAIAFSADGLSYFTIGEGLHAPIYQYELPPRPDTDQQSAE
jgi:hypothetical protein